MLPMLVMALAGIVIALLPVSARSEYIGAGASSGAKCRVFVVATHEQTRFVLAESHADSDDVDLHDDFPVVRPAISALPLDDVYKKLRPSFLAIQAALLARPRPHALEPRHCHAHIVASGAAVRAIDRAKLDVVFARVHQDSIEDAQFPFLLARDDLRTLPAELESYFLVAGANVLDGKMLPSLVPGKTEVTGLLRLGADATELSFDTLDRWRRNRHSKLKHALLNASDLFSREFAGFGATALGAAVDKLLARQSAADGAAPPAVLKHPCFANGFTRTLDENAKGPRTIEGAGDAAACLQAVRSVVDASNAACPAGSYCALSGEAQPLPFGAFYGAGLFRSAVLFAAAALRGGAEPALALPTPTLAALRAAATRVCALPAAALERSQLAYAPGRSGAFACLDLCATVALLRQFGVQDDDARVHFSPLIGATATSFHALDEDDAARLTGAFLWLEALQQRRAFAVEAELLAVQVDEGVPIGVNLSLLVLVAALAFLFAGATRGGAGGSHRGRAGSYQRVATAAGVGKAKAPANSTQPILFIDDASE